MKKQSNHLEKFLYFGAITLLVVLFSGFILEKSQVTNLYTKPVSSANTDEARPVNDIQFTPADPTDNNAINQQKEDGSIGSTSPTPSAGDPINVVLTAAGQDEMGGPVIVKVLLTDVSTGTCNVTIAKDSITKSYSAGIINTGTYYSCDGFDIPFKDLEPGTWKVSVTVSNADRTGTAEQVIQIGS